MQKPRSKSAIQPRTTALIVLLALILTGCKPSAPKTIPAGPEILVPQGETVIVHASAKRAVTYKWRLQGAGQLSDCEEKTIAYTAPEEGGVAILTVTAHNAWGASPSAVLTIRPPAFVPLDALTVSLVPFPCEGGKNSVDWEGSPDNCRSDSNCLRFTYKRATNENRKGCGEVHWRPRCIASAISPTLTAIPFWPYYVATIVPGGECRTDVLKAGNLNEVSHLVFWVRGEQGGEIIEFGIGGPDVEPSPGRSTEITLQPAWERHRIDLAGLDLTRATVLFRWRATDAHNPQGAVFYLDDIQFGGVRPAR